MRYKYETWHLIPAIALLVILYSYGGFSFLGALTGFCQADEPTSISDFKTDIGLWSFNGVTPSVTGDVYNWNLSMLTVQSVPSCGAFIDSITATAGTQNLTINSGLEADRRVVEIQGTYYWCNANDSIFFSSNSLALKDLWFETYFVCTECQPGISEKQTCANGNNITAKTCSATGTWTYPQSCPETVVTTPASQPAPKTTMETCGPLEKWVSEEHKCVLMGCASSDDCGLAFDEKAGLMAKIPCIEGQCKPQTEAAVQGASSGIPYFLIVLGILFAGGLGYIIYKAVKK